MAIVFGGFEVAEFVARIQSEWFSRGAEGIVCVYMNYACERHSLTIYVRGFWAKLNCCDKVIWIVWERSEFGNSIEYKYTTLFG